jgi:hypothetical protein
MGRMRLVVATILLGVLAACTNPVRMTKADATADDYKRDKGNCDVQASRTARGRLLGARDATEAHNRVLLSCMQDRGWEQVAK